MKRRRRHRPKPSITDGSYGRFRRALFYVACALVAGVLLWRIGIPIFVVVDTGDVVLEGDALVAQREVVRALFGALAWLLIAGLGIVGLCVLAVLLLQRSRRLVKLMGETKSHTTVGLVLAFIAGLIDTGKPDLGVVASATESSHQPLGGLTEVTDADYVASSRPESSPASLASVRNEGVPLPALASVGLAVGVAAHIQRERAVLLRDAPASARVKRPSAAALATGIALFDRARAAEPQLSGTSHTAVGDPSMAAPLVVPLGVAHDRLVSLTMQPGEAVSIEAGEDDGLGVLRHMLNTVALAPWLHQPVVVACGFGDDDVIVRRGVVMTTTPAEAKHHALRAKHEEPLATVMVVAREYSSELVELHAHGVLVVSRCIDDHDKTIHITRERNHWRLSTTNECFRPYAVSHAEASSLQGAVQEMTVLETTDLAVATPWHTLVRVLGPVQVVGNDQSEVTFRKSKSVELLCWLAFHRDRPTVSGARTALWEIDVRDATFHNVLSELRHGLGTAGLVNGAGRVNKQRLYLDDRIVTDGESLRATLQRVESLPTDKASAQLQEALAFVRGLPFSSMNYAWADAEGITSTLVWLVTRSVECAADLATQRCDRTALLAAVSAGLRMSPADEQFTALLDRVPSGMLRRDS